MPDKIAVIGECMLELTGQLNTYSEASVPMQLSYGGDTLNCAVYMARLDSQVDYVTALGDDNMSGWLIDQWQKNGVGCELVDRIPSSVPGLYMVEVDEHGERSFNYWRDNAPAKRLFDDPNKADKLFTELSQYQWLYLSGISLAIYSDAARQRLFSLLAEYRKNGGKIIFDDNYRPKLWASETAAQAAYKTMYRLTDIALPTLEDEQLLFNDADHHSVITRLQSWGVKEIALKMGEQGCMVVCGDSKKLIESKQVNVVDTTSAGDSFNAGYLSARLVGETPQKSAQSGCHLASVVIQHRGAIIPIEAMPKT